MSELSQGTQINGRYTLQEYKGSGSFGEVWLAHDDIIDTDVALKIYVSLNPTGISQFTEEYKTTANLSHPNLLTAKHFDVWERRPFLEMKYCGRGSADNLVGNITEKELWHFIHDVAAGLHYLHNLSTPIIHQDIKPDNVLMDDDGMFLITDFGISKQLRATIRKQSGRSDASGSCAYMGPERFNADPTPIKASDIWSLGASIYELAKGELPFYGQGGVMLKNGADLPELGDGWSSELNQTIQTCLAKDPWNRPTAEQLEKYAETILQSLESGRPVANALWIKAQKDEIIPFAENHRNETIGDGRKPNNEESLSTSTFMSHFSIWHYIYYGIGILGWVWLFADWLDYLFRGLLWHDNNWMSIFGLCAMLLSLTIVIASGKAFFSIQNNAVAMVKSFIILIVFDSIIIVLINFPPSLYILPFTIPYYVWAIVGWLYLQKSMFIKRTFPQATHTVSLLNKIIFPLALLFVLLYNITMYTFLFR